MSPGRGRAVAQGADAGLAGGGLPDRLEALRAVCAGRPRGARRGVNLHVHTNESFSVFRSPTEAVAQAVRERLAVLGINDHYTVAGHEEFRAACRLARLPAAFSLEAVAMDRAAERAGRLLNDPDNPGRAYLCAKGVTRYPVEDSPPGRALAAMRAAVAERSREMNARLGGLFRERLRAEGPPWEEVLRLTPRGNVTERHVAGAAWLRLEAAAAGRTGALGESLAALCGAAPASLEAPAAQNFIRGRLLKAGGAAYVAESPRAFLPLEDMRELFLAFGAVPTYPVLGDPVTDGERDVGALLAALRAGGIHALEVIPGRNSRGRLAEVLAAARAVYAPVFCGTEHNTPEARPLLDALMLDPELAPQFEAGAAVLLGHQAEAAASRPGFVDARGEPTVADARERFEFFERAGRRSWRAAEAS